VQSGGPISFLLSGRPTRARALAPAPRSPRAADSPAPPVSDTAARYCAGPHVSSLSRAVSDRPSVRARRTSPARAAHGLLPAPPAGRDRTPRAPARRVALPRPGPPLPSSFPLSAALPPSALRRAFSLRAEIVFLTPLRLLSRVLEPPRHSPHPDRRLRPPEPASPSRNSADLRRRPPLPGELFPEPPIPGISCNFLTPSPLPSCRTSSATPATTGGPSPPTNAAARRRWHRLTVDPPFRCAPVPSSLPGAFPVTPSRPPAAPCRRRATAEPSASAPPRRPARGDRADAPAVRAQRARRPVPPLGWAARPWPSRRSADRAWQAAAPRGL
jgi:hypothetical protein